MKNKEQKSSRRIYWFYTLAIALIFFYFGPSRYVLYATIIFAPISVFLIKRFIDNNALYKTISVQHILQVIYTYLLLFLWFLFLPVPLIQPPLVFDTPSHSEFLQRVREKYPEGTPSDKVTNSLYWQRFDIKTKDGKHFYARYARNWPLFCVREWNISWQIDEEQNTKNIKASVTGACV